MANPVINGSMLSCSMSCSLPIGIPVLRMPSYPPGAPGQFLIFPDKMLNFCSISGSNISDTNGKVVFPATNSCQSQINPTVISASAAASIPPAPPSFVPAPCTPLFPGPWTPGSFSCLLKGQPILNNTSNLSCSMGGIISIINTSAITVNIP